MGLRNREDLNNAGAEEFRKLGGLFGVEVLGQGRGGGDERRVVGLRQQRVRVIAEDRDRRRVDHRVAVAIVPFATMIRVHRRILNRQVERAGAA